MVWMVQWLTSHTLDYAKQMSNILKNQQFSVLADIPFLKNGVNSLELVRRPDHSD